MGDHTFINSQTIEVSDNIIRMHANYNSLDFGGIEVVDDSGVVRQFLWSNIEDRCSIKWFDTCRSGRWCKS